MPDTPPLFLACTVGVLVAQLSWTFYLAKKSGRSKRLLEDADASNVCPLQGKTATTVRAYEVRWATAAGASAPGTGRYVAFLGDGQGASRLRSDIDEGRVGMMLLNGSVMSVLSCELLVKPQYAASMLWVRVEDPPVGTTFGVVSTAGSVMSGLSVVDAVVPAIVWGFGRIPGTESES